MASCAADRRCWRFFPRSNEVAEAGVELGIVIDVIVGELAGMEDRQKLRVPVENGVGTEIGRGLHRLVLQDGGAKG